MSLDTSVIGRPTMRATVVVERGPVENFAKTLEARNPIYLNEQKAKDAGFANIPAPPTWGFVMEHWGKFEEFQDGEKVEGNPVAEVIGPRLAKGGLILHGEQFFEYHRPIVVGDILCGEGKVVDVYEKESKGKTMAFVVVETVWKDKKTEELVLTTRLNFIHRG
jgi:peroxisomal enoyl-CoA hydratase 2